MKVFGKIDYRGEEYFYEYSTSTGRHFWRLYHTQILTDNDETVIKFPINFLGASKPEFNRFLVGALLYTTDRNTYSISGNIRLLESVIAEMQIASSYSYESEDKSETTTGLLTLQNYRSKDGFSYVVNKYKGCISRLEFSTPACSMSTFKEDTSYSTSFTVPKWLALKADAFGTISADMKSRISALQFKSLPQLRHEKNGLPWYFNDDGSIKKDYKVIDSVEEFDRLCDEVFPNVKVAAIDIESTGLDFFDSEDKSWLSEMVGFGIAWKRDQGIYLPLLHESFNSLPFDYVLERMKPFLEKWIVVTHNGLFDGRVFYHYGIMMNIIHDTMQMGFVFNPHVQKGSKALKQMTHRRYGHETLELKDIVKNRKDVVLFKFFPKELVQIYACADVDYTLQLALDMLPELEGPLMKPYRRDMSLYPELIKSEYAGNAIDVDLMNRLSEAEDKDMEVLKTMIYTYVGRKFRLDCKYNELTTVGKLDKEELDLALSEYQQTPEYQEASIEFKLSGKELADALYSVLGYPIVRKTKSGTPSTDKFAIEDLKTIKLRESSGWLKEDVPSNVCSLTDIYIDDKERTLISKEEFNMQAYPVAYLLSVHNKLNKRKTAFFNPMKADNRNGRYYTGNSLTAAETSRIINKIQILSGYLKRLVVPYSKDHYMFVFDFKQIEYRVMAGLAGQEWLVERLRNPRADYHREGGANLMGTTPEKMTSKQRKDIKAVNFAVPYGMGAQSLACNLFKTLKPTKGQLEYAEVLLSKWYRANPEIKLMLDKYRTMAHTKGQVSNPSGRRRVFDLEKLTYGQVDRMAGNFPIQSFAAELFKNAFLKFRKKLKELGIEDKVTSTALVHDEIVNVVHKSVSPYLLYKIVWEECMLEIPGHPKYYAGISVCNNWFEGKADLYEAPVEYVGWAVEEFNAGRKTNEWCDNPRDMILDDIRGYLPQLYIDDLTRLQPDLTYDNIRLDLIMPKFTDYFLIPSSFLFYKANRKIDKANYDTKSKDKVFAKAEEERLDRDKIIVQLETILLSHFGRDLTVTYPDGIVSTVTYGTRNILEMVDDADVFLSEEAYEDDLNLSDEIYLNDDLDFADDIEAYYSDVEYSRSIPTTLSPSYGKDESFEYEDYLVRESATDSRSLSELTGGNMATYKPEDMFDMAIVNNELRLDMTGRNNDTYMNKLAEYMKDKVCAPDTLGGYKLTLMIQGARRETKYYVRNFIDSELAALLDKNMLFDLKESGAEYANVRS